MALPAVEFLYHQWDFGCGGIVVNRAECCRNSRFLCIYLPIFNLHFAICNLHFQICICRFAFSHLHFCICIFAFAFKKEVGQPTSQLTHHFFYHFIGEQSHRQLSYQPIFISADRCVVAAKICTNVLQCTTLKVSHFQYIIVWVIL